jgi:hypothetical protein
MDSSLDALVDKLVSHTHPLDEYLWDSFSSATQSLLANPSSGDEEIKRALVRELNEVLTSGSSIYTSSRFAGVRLLKATEDLRQKLAQSQEPSAEELIRLNRLLLEDAYRKEIARSPDRSFVVQVVTAGEEWRLIRLQKGDADRNFLGPAISNKVFYGEQYTVARNSTSGAITISQDWRGIEYRTGQGNFPLWESEILRPVFRTLFTDWMDGTENFPDLGDAPTTDPNQTPPASLSFGTFPAFVPFAPTAVAATTGDIVVDGADVLNFVGNQHFVNILGNGDATADTLELNVIGDVILEGFIGGGGLTDIKVTATGTITVLDGSTVSSRQVGATANHWNAASTADSGDVTLEARAIVIGRGANLLAHATGAYAAGNVTLTASDSYEQTWSFLGIANYRWIETEAEIALAVDARITGYDVTIQTTAITRKTASLDAVDFSTPTMALVLGDVTGGLTNRPDLIVATFERGILLYEHQGDGFAALPTAIESGVFATSSLALGDVDNDGDLDLVAGNRGQANYLYLNDGTGVFTAASFGSTLDTTAVALANVDADAALELVVGTHEDGIFL